MCTETEPSSIHLEGETSLLQHPGLPDAHDTGASTWRGRNDITYLQPRPYHLSPKGISIPSSSLTHYSKHCLVPAQHVPVTLAPARGARRPCPSLTTPRHSTAVDLWDSFFSHSCKPVPLFTASMCGFRVQVKSHGLQLQTSPLRPGKRWLSQAPVPTKASSPTRLSLLWSIMCSRLLNPAAGRQVPHPASRSPSAAFKQ